MQPAQRTRGLAQGGGWRGALLRSGWAWDELAELLLPVGARARLCLVGHEIDSASEVQLGERMTAVCHKGDYIKWRLESDAATPSLALGLNSGLGTDQNLWREVLQLLLEEEAPLVFTSFDDADAESDARELDALEASRISEPNPFFSALPELRTAKQGEAENKAGAAQARARTRLAKLTALLFEECFKRARSGLQHEDELVLAARLAQIRLKYDTTMPGTAPASAGANADAVGRLVEHLFVHGAVPRAEHAPTAADSPKRHRSPPDAISPAPDTVTTVPPDCGPLHGATPLTTLHTDSYCTPSDVKSTPLVLTSTETYPATDAKLLPHTTASPPATSCARTTVAFSRHCR